MEVPAPSTTGTRWRRTSSSSPALRNWRAMSAAVDEGVLGAPCPPVPLLDGADAGLCVTHNCIAGRLGPGQSDGPSCVPAGQELQLRMALHRRCIP
jgi:hypothetical protein